jgi:homogentisate 1,2-dioxygenase
MLANAAYPHYPSEPLTAILGQSRVGGWAFEALGGDNGRSWRWGAEQVLAYAGYPPTSRRTWRGIWPTVQM